MLRISGVKGEGLFKINNYFFSLLGELKLLWRPLNLQKLRSKISELMFGFEMCKTWRHQILQPVQKPVKQAVLSQRLLKNKKKKKEDDP